VLAIISFLRAGRAEERAKNAEHRAERAERRARRSGTLATINDSVLALRE
jgi:hypothetical protein